LGALKEVTALERNSNTTKTLRRESFRDHATKRWGLGGEFCKNSDREIFAWNQT